MTWDEQLFAVLDDLEGQAQSAFALERDLELADRSQAEYRQVTLASRLMASVGSDLALDVAGVGRLTGELRRCGEDWLLVAGRGQEWVVPAAAVGAVRGAAERSVPEAAWSPLTRLSFAAALRRIAAVRGECLLHTRDGSRHEARLLRVGQDFVEAEVGAEPGGMLFAFARLAAVQRRSEPDPYA